MANKSLFSTIASIFRPTDTVNEAGGKAYTYSDEHALAQYAATGTFNQTFYASADEQLKKVLELCDKVPIEFVAKTAIYARERGYMKDMPALLTAYLASKDAKLLRKVFPRVIDNGKMLRNFVQMIRSGVCARKSFGSAPKRLIQTWFASRSTETIFRQSLGNAPSMADVIKMCRPSPKLPNGEVDRGREALYGYLIGKKVDEGKLPKLIQDFEHFKTHGGEIPNVPFEMLTALSLDRNQWKQIAKNMSWQQTRMNLNTLARHGVFSDEDSPWMIKMIAKRLRDRETIRKAKVFPYQLMSAYLTTQDAIVSELREALKDAMEIAVENVPSCQGKVYVCPDVSGSMHSSVTGFRPGATSSVRCIDVAALIAAAFLRNNSQTEVVPFSDDVVKVPRVLSAKDSVMDNAQLLATLPSGGTSCSAPLRMLNRQNAKGDLVVYISDNMSWYDFGLTQPNTSPTPMAREWETFKKRNPKAKLVLIDIQPYSSTQVPDHPDVMNIGGFSDQVFDIIHMFLNDTLQGNHWVSVIEKVNLDLTSN